MALAHDERGADHLVVLACAPRPAGSVAERSAREYAARVLERCGFRVGCTRFTYSAFPGRYATPIGGALAAETVLVGAWLGMQFGAPWGAFAELSLGVVVLAAFTSSMLGDAVLTLPWLRVESENLVATRGTGSPAVWLVAHLDSKSQPVPTAFRLAGIALLSIAILLAFLAALLQLAALPFRMAWLAAIGAAALGGPLVMASVVGAGSPGALDNASGVATVLTAAAAARPDVSVGVLLPSAEELGLAGARAWARTQPPGIALNCDGVDDDGEITIMYTHRRPRRLVDMLQRLATRPLRVRRMPPGLLTDSIALSDRGWTTVTVSRGSLATLGRVHTAADSLTTLRGDGIDEVATLLARAVEALG